MPAAITFSTASLPVTELLPATEELVLLLPPLLLTICVYLDEEDMYPVWLLESCTLYQYEPDVPKMVTVSP
ncbi:hypothetical protein D1872_265790 [compost metagenome]